MRVLLGCLVLLTPLFAQLSANPATWTRLEGQFLRDAGIEDAALLVRAAEVRVVQARAARQLLPDAAALATAVAKLSATPDHNTLWRLTARLLAVYAGRAPGPWLEFASSLDFQLDRGVLTPGARLHARLLPLFRAGRSFDEQFHARLTLLNEQGEAIRVLDSIPLTHLEEREVTLPTESLAPGQYAIRYELLSREATLLACDRPFLVDPQWRGRAARIRADVEKAALAGATSTSPRHAAAAGFAAWVADAMERIADGDPPSLSAAVHPFTAHFALPALPRTWNPEITPAAIDRAAAWAAALLDGRDPLDGLSGDLRLVLPGTRNIFRVHLPAGYDPAREWPLLVVLHSGPGDENTWFDNLAAGALAALADRHGYIVLAPRVRSIFALPGEAQRQEILDLIGFTSRLFRVDRRRVMLAGHGLGAGAAFAMKLAHPGEFAATAAIGGVPPPSVDITAGRDFPLLFCYSPADPPTSGAPAVQWAAYMQRRGTRSAVVRLSAAPYGEAAREALEAMFAFFDKPPAAATPPP